MANKLETAKNYLVSVAERTVGINAYRRWQKHAVEHFDPTYEGYQNRKGTGILIASPMQFLMPATTEAIARSWSKSQFGTGEETKMNPLIWMAKYATISEIDAASWILMSTTDSLPQFILYKLAANAATHVALDLGGAAVRRLKHFRPSATTLTI